MPVQFRHCYFPPLTGMAATVESQISISYFTTEFDFTRGFCQWHIRWPLRRLSVGIRSRIFKTMVRDGDETITNRWLLEIVRGVKGSGSLAVRLHAVSPPIPTPAVIRLSLLDGSTKKLVPSAVNYTVFSAYAADDVFQLPPSTTVLFDGHQGGHHCEAHIWLLLPVDLASKRSYYARAVSYVFGRELRSYHRPVSKGRSETKSCSEDETLRIDVTLKEVDDNGDGSDARTDQMAIADRKIVNAVFRRSNHEKDLNELLKSFIKYRRTKQKGKKRKRPIEPLEEPRWPVKPWYEAVMIACFSSDKDRINQWNAISRNHCSSLPQLKAICLAQLGAVTERCCASPDIELVPKGTAEGSTPPENRKSPSPGRSNARPSEDAKKKMLRKLHEELAKKINFLMPVETINLKPKGTGCRCAIT